MELNKEVLSGVPPVFQTMHESAQGGFTLDITGLTVGANVPAGTAVVLNEATRMAKPVTADSDTPGGLVYFDVVVKAGAQVAVVRRGTVYARRIPTLSATLRAKLPNIIFSESF